VPQRQSATPSHVHHGARATFLCVRAPPAYDLGMQDKQQYSEDAKFGRKRIGEAVSHLATSHHELRERVLHAYYWHVSDVPLTPKFFPDRETLNDIKTIRDTIQTAYEKIEKNPGPYEEHLREGIMNSLEIARSALDHRVARKLANLITELHFKLQDSLEREYKDDLWKHARSKVQKRFWPEFLDGLSRSSDKNLEGRSP
jgi:hypothetical protein